jgi:hypothetical protein
LVMANAKSILAFSGFMPYTPLQALD